MRSANELKETDEINSHSDHNMSKNLPQCVWICWISRSIRTVYEVSTFNVSNFKRCATNWKRMLHWLINMVWTDLDCHIKCIFHPSVVLVLIGNSVWEEALAMWNDESFPCRFPRKGNNGELRKLFGTRYYLNFAYRIFFGIWTANSEFHK